MKPLIEIINTDNEPNLIEEIMEKIESKLEQAKYRYKLLLKQSKHIKNVSDKNFERTYHKLCGMESILECLGVDINKIQNEVYDEEIN
jgi:DNA replication initiation complex subunit (GINS family)